MLLDAEVVVEVDVLTAEEDGPELSGLDGLVPGHVVLDTGALLPDHLLHRPNPGDAEEKNSLRTKKETLFLKLKKKCS